MRIDGPNGTVIEVAMADRFGNVTDDPSDARWAEAWWSDGRRDYIVFPDHEREHEAGAED